MKTADVWSSPNLDGLIASSKNNYITGLKRTGAEIEEIHLNSQHIEHCKACGNGLGLCYTQGRCVIKDDFEAIYQKLKIADGIVFISAVYWFDLTECMKAFLDRLRRCDAMYNGSQRKNLLLDCVRRRNRQWSNRMSWQSGKNNKAYGDVSL